MLRNLNKTFLNKSRKEWNWIFCLTIISSLYLRYEVQYSDIDRSLQMYTKRETEGYNIPTTSQYLDGKHTGTIQVAH